MIKKEGPKVLGYCTTKKCILGAVEWLIWTTSTQHLIIYIKVLKYFLLKFIQRYLYLDRNLADLGYFRSTLANLVLQNAYKRRIWYSRAHTEVLMGSIVLECQNFVLLGRRIWTIVGKMTNLTIKSCFEADYDFSIHFFFKYIPRDPQILSSSIKWPHWYLQGV